MEFDGQVLDLRQIGVEAWIAAVMEGRRPPAPLSPGQFERELQNVLLHWRDDERLAASPLAVLTESAAGSDDAGVAKTLRQVVETALERAVQRSPRDEDHLAARAVTLAYLQRQASHERLAERLNVSRSTFYRLLKRGVAGIAAELRTPA